MLLHSHDTPEIFIILSTHDAGRHLKSQIESIQTQSYSNWRLLVRDDDSTDGTIERIAAYANSDSRISSLPEDRHGRLGAAASYSCLIEAALARGAQWIALADQDDVWNPNKLERQVRVLFENPSSPEQPRLLHTDLEVVDENLKPISDSFLAYAGLRHVDTDPLRTLIIQNFVTGCSCLFSRGLAARSVPIPREAIMHDWWLALNAVAWGKIEFLSTSTAQYRQHPGNQIGAKSYRRSIWTLVGRSVGFRRSDMDELVAIVRQARAFRDHLRRRSIGDLDDPRIAASLKLTEDFVSLFAESVGRFERVLGLRRLGISRQDPIRNATLQAKLLVTSFPAQKA